MTPKIRKKTTHKCASFCPNNYKIRKKCVYFPEKYANGKSMKLYFQNKYSENSDSIFSEKKAEKYASREKQVYLKNTAYE